MTTIHAEFFEGIPVTIPNRIVGDSGDFYISYNDYDRRIYGGATTALVVGQMQGFYILNGDHSKSLAGLSFADALAYVHAHSSQLNKMSDTLPPIGSTVEQCIKFSKIVWKNKN